VERRLEAVNGYISKMEIPSELATRMRRYFRHYYDERFNAVDEAQILSDLSTGLRLEVRANPSPVVTRRDGGVILVRVECMRGGRG